MTPSVGPCVHPDQRAGEGGVGERGEGKVGGGGGGGGVESKFSVHLRPKLNNYFFQPPFSGHFHFYHFTKFTKITSFNIISTRLLF